MGSTEYYDGTTWSEAPEWDLPSPRYSHCAVVFKGSLVLIGGNMGWMDGLTDSVIRLNTRRNRWDDMERMSIALEEHACTVATVGERQKIFVSGGRLGNIRLNANVYMFEEYRGWDKVGNLVRPRRNHVMGFSGRKFWSLDLHTQRVFHENNEEHIFVAKIFSWIDFFFLQN